jgi:superfamily II DNA or RNA helicase
MLILESPTKLRLEGYDTRKADLERLLTYTNKAKVYELARFKKNRWFIEQHGEERFKEECARLKSETKVCLLKEDDRGLWTYPGLVTRLQKQYGDLYQNNVQYPEIKGMPWFKVPTGTDRYYQTRMHDNLLAGRHAAVEVGTGLGKSRVIRNLTHTIGLKTLVVAPSKSIGRQLYKDFVEHFGRAKVGFFGDGKKEPKKQIVVGLFQSLTRVKEDSNEWKELAKAEVFIVDESHLTPAATLRQVCDGIASGAPYRFFFSGTQMRNDGADLLLEGIIGPVVYEMTVKQGVEEGFLSKPNFYVIDMVSPSSYVSNNPEAMVDRHFYSNTAMYARAADIANKSINLLGHQVLILIDEVTQFQHIIPFLRHQTGFAHGGVTKVNKGTVPAQYHDSDPEVLVDQLNAGLLPILVGTSCISIGTDIRTPKTVINLQGGTSEVKIRQAIGRGTRREDGVKEEFNYWDFKIRVKHPEDPEFESNTERHAIIREGIYRDVFPSLRVVS